MLKRLARLVDPGGGSVDEALARIAALRSAGRLDEALRLAAERWRRSDDVRLAAELMQLRHAAFKRGEGRADWPPAYPDAFAGAGIPEIEAHELKTAAMAGGILHHGAVIVRGLLKEPQLASLRQVVDGAMEAAGRAPAERLDAQPGPAYAPVATEERYVIDARTFTELGAAAVLAGDSPRAFQTLVDLYERMGVFRAVEGYLGERPVLSLAKTVLRRAPITTGTNWHQDGAFLGASIRVVNLWVALSDCGVDAPGLDMIPGRVPEVLKTGTDGAVFDWSVGEGAVERVLEGRKVYRPVFKAGDAIMFDHLFLHRTAVSPEMTKPRYAVEMWMFAPSTFPDQNFALVV